MLGNKIAVVIDEFDFSTAFFNATTEHVVAEKDSTTFQADATSSEPGLVSDKMTLRGYYSGHGTGDVYAELRDRLGDDGRDTRMAVLIDTTDANCVAECHPDAWGKMLKIDMAAPELITFEINTADSEGMETGRRVLGATVTATGNHTAVDFGAAGSAGGTVYVFVQEIGGTATNAGVKVQSATTQGGSYSDEATVTFSAVGGYTAALDTGVNRWVRVNVANMGGATSIKLTVIVCVKGVTY